jgi:replication-associated recombination protein RarA
MSYHLNTRRGYSFPAVSSAMQKAIRRGDAKLAGYWALELWASGFGQYVWRRLLTESAEDCSARLLGDSHPRGQGVA